MYTNINPETEVDCFVFFFPIVPLGSDNFLTRLNFGELEFADETCSVPRNCCVRLSVLWPRDTHTFPPRNSTLLLFLVISVLDDGI